MPNAPLARQRAGRLLFDHAATMRSVTARICWSCDVKSHHARIGDHAYRNRKTGEWQAAFKCDECGAVSIGVHHISDTNLDSRGAATALARFTDLTWLPVRALGKHYQDVPEHVAAAASEAHSCHSIGAYRAAVLMTRSVIEATAKDRGITTGTLYDKIDKMRERDLIGELVRHQAHEIRLFGNDMAHGDFVAPVTEEASAEIVTLMDKVLASVYQDPAQLAALKQAREEREQGTT